MQRFIIPDEDLLALDGLPNLPDSVQNAILEVKKARPVAVELPYDFVEDMTSRAEHLHATLSDLIVSFCRRWISVNGNADDKTNIWIDRDLYTGLKMIAEKYGFNSASETIRNAVLWSRLVTSVKLRDLLVENRMVETQDDIAETWITKTTKCTHDSVKPELAAKFDALHNDTFTPQDIAQILAESDIDPVEFGDLCVVTVSTITRFLKGKAVNTQTRAKIAAGAQRVFSGVYAPSRELVTSGALARIIQRYREDNPHNSLYTMAEKCHVGIPTLQSVLNSEMPARYDSVRRIRKFFNV